MTRFLARRFVSMVLVLIVVSSLVFIMSRAQGDPRLLYLTETTTKEQWEQWGEKMGLDRPLPLQYLVWLGKAVRGDFGESLREFRPASEAVLERLPATLQLGLAAWVYALLLGWPLGVLSAIKRGTVWDYAGRSFALFGQALPPFWLGIMLILLFSVSLGWLPTAGRGGITHLILPAVTLGSLAAAGQLRLVRSAMLNVMDSEYIKLARAKGVSQRKIIWKHALRNAMIPPMTYAGLILAGFVGGTVVTESVFAWPGVGRLAIESVYQNDFPVLAATVILTSVLYLVVNFVIDIAYAFVDPRIRLN